MPQKSLSPRIIIALDYPLDVAALELVERLDPSICRLKIGKEMFTRYGPALVEKITAKGFDLFLDLKFHDIPNTTAAACAAAADLGVWMIDLHASGGSRMMDAARQRLDSLSNPPLLIAVTLLTSLAAQDMAEIGWQGEPSDHVLRLAGLARSAGMDGIVCSPQEARLVTEQLPENSQHDADFLLVTPGIRPTFAASDDQQRVTTPSDALGRGADFLVIGRPITAAADPLAALQAIRKEICEI